MNAVEVQQLSYRYGRKTEALHEISLDVPRGAIYGLIGPNGAGKSTLLQCCAGLRYAGSGSVRVFGADARKRSPIVAGVMTYMAEAVKLPARMTLAQLEAYIAPLHAKRDGGVGWRIGRLAARTVRARSCAQAWHAVPRRTDEGGPALRAGAAPHAAADGRAVHRHGRHGQG